MIEDATTFCIMDQYFMGKPVLHEIYRGWTGKYRLPAAESCIPAYLLCKNSSCFHSIGQYNGTHVEQTKELPHDDHQAHLRPSEPFDRLEGRATQATGNLAQGLSEGQDYRL